MLHIILLILKIIGIILLSILGLIMLIILMVLLIPIRYRIAAEHGEAMLKVNANASWLLHLINARVTHLDGIFHIKIKLLWFTLFDNLKPKQPKIRKLKLRKRTKRNKKGEKKSKLTKDSKTIYKATPKNNKKDVTNIKKEIVSELKSEPVKKAQVNNKADTVMNKSNINTDGTINPIEDIQIHYFNPKQPVHNSINQETEQIKENKSDQSTKEKMGVFQRIYTKIRDAKNKVINFFVKQKEKIINWYHKVINIKQKIDIIRDFLQNQINQQGFKVTYSSLKRLLKHILPRKLKSVIKFGTGDPCSTGQVLGVMGVLYSFYGDRIQILPDFENKIFEGKHYARGRIRLVTLLIIVIKLLLNKRFKRLKENFLILKEAL